MDVFFSRFTTSGLGGTQSCDTTLVPGGVETVSRASCDVSTDMMVDGGDAASSGLVPGDVARFYSGNSSGIHPFLAVLVLVRGSLGIFLCLRFLVIASKIHRWSSP